MTNIRFRILIPPATGAIGTITACPTARRTTVDGIVLPVGLAIIIAGATVTRDFAPTSDTWVWQFVEGITGGKTRYCTVPDSVSTIDYEDLEDVDPTSFTPTAESFAGWTAAAAAAQTSAIAAEASADDAAVAAASVAGALPLMFAAATATTGVTASDRAYVTRTLTGARMRVAGAPVGSSLIVQVQHFDGSSWTTLATLTTTTGSTVEATAAFTQDQFVGNLVRLNVTSVGSDTAASGVAVDVTWH